MWLLDATQDLPRMAELGQGHPYVSLPLSFALSLELSSASLPAP